MSARRNSGLLTRRLFCLWLLLWPAAWLVPALSCHAANSIVEVSVLGLEGEALENAQASLEIERHRDQAGLDATRIRELHEKAEGDIRRALQPFGYYQPQIEAQLQAPADATGPWHATYQVDPGPLIAVAALQLDFGDTRDPDLDTLAAQFPLQPGTPLDHRHYEEAKRDLLQQVRALGYRHARWQEHRVEVDLVRYQATIQLSLRTGPRFVIGQISFEQRRFDDAWLQRYLVLQPGQAFTGEALAQQRRVLGRSGYFREVEIVELQPLEGDQTVVPLKIVLDEYQPNRYRGSLGWGTDTGFGVQLDWTRRYVGGRGQRFNVGLAAVEDRQRLAGDINYTIPLQPLDGSEIELAARHESKDLSYEDVGLEVGGDTRISTNLLSAFWHPALRQWGQYRFSSVPGISLVTETYDVFEVLFGYFSKEEQQFIIDSIGPQAYDTLAPDFEAVVASLNLQLSRADNGLFIRDGEYLGLELLGANDSLGSNITFWQATLESWFIRPLFTDDRLLLRAAAGYSDAESREVLDVNFNLMPEYYEYRAGGVRSIRGYGWESLVPESSITGGKHLAVGSIEYEHQVIPNWSLAVFLDGGNAFNDFDNIDPKYGTGLGVRWRSPVGVARLDIGIPLDKADDAFEIYITVGPEF
ncbi:autotransporter assembly complex protein TamA [Haliea sp. E17]|uniref:autotransporter assembly complex protein TamA n=1 Tax=Haliea sp. E17 TaxID=3401576 RepID=UPI003AAC17BD